MKFRNEYKHLQKTQWFDSDTKPVHVGYYECIDPEEGWISEYLWYWDGTQWLSEQSLGFVCMSQDREWRGKISQKSIDIP